MQPKTSLKGGFGALLVRSLPNYQGRPGAGLALEILRPVLVGVGITDPQRLALQRVDSLGGLVGLLALGCRNVDVLGPLAGIDFIDAIEEQDLPFFRFVMIFRQSQF